MKEFRSKSEIIACTVEDQRETLYECPPNCRARIPLIYIVNANGSTTVNFEWYRAEDTAHYYIISGKNLSLGDTIQLSDGYIVLEAGDKLEVTPSGNNSPEIDAFCTAEEFFFGNAARN